MKKLITENGIKITAQKKFTVNFFPEPLPITAYEEMEKRHAAGWGSAKEKVYKGGNDFFYRWWQIHAEMPEGYYEDKDFGSPLSHTVFIINGSPLRGGNRALLYVK